MSLSGLSDENTGYIANTVADFIPEAKPVEKGAHAIYNMVYYFSIFGMIIAIIMILLAFYTLIQSDYTGTAALAITGGIIGGAGIYFYKKTKPSFNAFVGHRMKSNLKDIFNSGHITYGPTAPQLLPKYDGEGEDDYIIGDPIETIDEMAYQGAFEDGCNCHSYTGGHFNDLNNFTEYQNDNEDVYLKHKTYTNISDNEDKELIHKMGFYPKKSTPKGRRRNKHGGEEFEVDVEGTDEKQLLVDLDDLIDKLNIQVSGDNVNEILQNLLNQIDDVKSTIDNLNNDEKEDIKKILNKLESESKHITNKIDLLKNKLL